MKSLIIILIVIISLATYSCKNQNSSAKISTANSGDTSSPVTQSSSPVSSTPANAEKANEMMDTTKLKSDMNDMLSSVTSGKPDTTKMKKAAGDIMTTDANMLSDSGIDKMYGNSNDPSVKAASDALKKMRNRMGLTPGKLDSMRKEASDLQH